MNSFSILSLPIVARSLMAIPDGWVWFRYCQDRLVNSGTYSRNDKTRKLLVGYRLLNLLQCVRTEIVLSVQDPRDNIMHTIFLGWNRLILIEAIRSSEGRRKAPWPRCKSAKLFAGCPASVAVVA
ncbi:hypothetical protein BJV78DRAFT_315030 [Lactifluus subvellereus]|nr:hypothetical protein BJV78DRAFT_315030 [Lactifluus subvellereus]